MATGNLMSGHGSFDKPQRRLACIWFLIGVLLVPGWATAAQPSADHAMGLFEVYERNRKEGVPNYITEDVLLLSYGMIRTAVSRAVEREHHIGSVGRIIEGLAVEVTAGPADPVNQANRDYLAVLLALWHGRAQAAGAGEPARAQAELDLVLASQALTRSPLWGQMVDYTQFKPRGHYSGDAELERYFRTVRYAGTVLFAVTASKATGVSEALAERLTRQAVRLARLIEQDPGLGKEHGGLLRSLNWRFGAPEDLPNAALLALGPEPAETFRVRLLAQAKEQGLQPRVIGGAVDAGQLEDGVTAADVMTGWRLLPQRYTPESDAFQRLVYDDTGVFQGTQDTTPFGVTLIDGKLVKGFPLLAELMALWGSEAAYEHLRQKGETAFEGYDAAWERAQQALASAVGLSALHQQLIRTGLRSESPDRLTALRGFWTWQRYAALLYAKQSYTPADKGLVLAPPRPAGARLEPSLPLYLALARVVEAHRRVTPHAAWEAFGEILDRVIAVALRADGESGLTAADEAFLNDLDAALVALTGGPDAPVVVDVHTNPASREVLQEATGMARLVTLTTAEGQAARGARFTQCEFKHPMAERLGDADWRGLLAASPHPCGETAATAQKEE